VYRDDEVRVENSPLVICSASKSRKLDDDEEFKCAIPLFEPEDPSAWPMYCKNKVQTLAYFKQGNPTLVLNYRDAYRYTYLGNG
jgi:hypothetical protein